MTPRSTGNDPDPDPGSDPGALLHDFLRELTWFMLKFSGVGAEVVGGPHPHLALKRFVERVYRRGRHRYADRRALRRRARTRTSPGG
ncbi:hypothetical protein [Streptomyces sp. NPDC059593]|uniref:hypothetical protein n=1 Tax=Streptomyces sp. NPDC059593 TaxID=3346878 RepID=UPI0036C02507